MRMGGDVVAHPAAFKPRPTGQTKASDNKVTRLRLRVGAGGTKTWIFRGRAGDRTINKKLGSYPGMHLSEACTAALNVVAAISSGGSAEAVERTFGAVTNCWVGEVTHRKNDNSEYQKTSSGATRQDVRSWPMRRFGFECNAEKRNCRDDTAYVGFRPIANARVRMLSCVRDWGKPQDE